MSKKGFFHSLTIPFVNEFSCQLNGTDQYLDGGDILNMVRTNPYSFVFWYKPLVISVARGVFNKIEPSPTFKGYQLQHEIDGTLSFYLLNSLANYVAVQGDSILNSITTWYHIAVTYSGGSDVASFKIYVDTVADSLTPLSDTLTLATTNTRDFNIGRRSDAARYVKCRIDEFAMYNIELSQAQLDEIYNSGVPKDPTKLSTSGDLLSWWGFKQEDIDNFPTIKDYSGNSRDLTAINMTTANIQPDVP